VRLDQDLLGKPLTDRRKQEIARAQAARDEDIDLVDVKAIRTRSGLSQAEFAKRYGFNVRTLQDWESSGVQPPSPVRAYLTVIDQFPDTVAKAFKGAA